MAKFCLRSYNFAVLFCQYILDFYAFTSIFHETPLYHLVCIFDPLKILSLHSLN